MEVSAFSTKTNYSSPTGSSSLLKKVESHQWHQISFPSYTRNSSQSLSNRIGLLPPKVNRLKVFSSKKKDIQVLEAESMDEIYDSLAERLVPTAAVASNPNFKHIVGIAGCPGAGKSTLASEVARRVNKLWAQRATTAMDELVDTPEVAISLPMDGFHLYRYQLDKMENPKEAHARRGAPWTFDPTSLLKCLQKLRTEGSVSMPSFDHGVGDPVEDDIFVSLQHKVVIVEGNYLLLEDGVWKDVCSVFDEKWFVQTDVDTAMQRVFKRFISETNLPAEIARWRIENNDRPNAEIVNKSKNNADLVIRSVNFNKSCKEEEFMTGKQ